jgi:hypothetical protein
MTAPAQAQEPRPGLPAWWVAIVGVMAVVVVVVSAKLVAEYTWTNPMEGPADVTLSLDGLGPLRWGMTIKQAKATGAIGEVREASPHLGPCVNAEPDPTGAYGSGDFRALFLRGELAGFIVDSDRLRTPEGVGRGAHTSVLATVPGNRVDHRRFFHTDEGAIVDITTGDFGYQFTIGLQGTIEEWAVGTLEVLRIDGGCT